jgi:hypothetical protein
MNHNGTLIKSLRDMNTYGIGGNEVPQDANEAITDIPENRTLLIEKLTNDPAISPEVVEGLNTVEQVFGHFKPTVDVEFKDKDGQFVNEELKFKNLGDFGKKGLSHQSGFLKDLTAERDEFQEIIKHMKSNKVLRKVMEDPDQKEGFLKAIRALIQELEQTNV